MLVVDFAVKNACAKKNCSRSKQKGQIASSRKTSWWEERTMAGLLGQVQRRVCGQRQEVGRHLVQEQ